jgi:hypothetical protein
MEVMITKASAVGRRPVHRETAEASFSIGKTDQAIPGERKLVTPDFSELRLPLGAAAG